MERELIGLPRQMKYVIVDVVSLAVRNVPLLKDYRGQCYNCTKERLKEMENEGVLVTEFRELGDVYKFAEKVVDEIGSYVEAGLELQVSNKEGGGRW